MWNVSKLQSIDIISIICTILFISWILKIIFIHFTLVCAWYMCSLFFVAVAAKAMLISFFGGIHILNTAQHCHNHNLQEYKYTFDVSSNFRCLFSYNFFLFYQSGWVFLRVRVQKDEIQSGCAEAKVTKLIREWMSYHDSRICTYAVIKKENHFFSRFFDLFTQNNNFHGDAEKRHFLGSSSKCVMVIRGNFSHFSLLLFFTMVFLGCHQANGKKYG